MADFLKSLKIKGTEIDPTGATTNQVLSYNGTKFVPVNSSGGATSSDSTPSSPTTGQLWFESDTGKLFVYYDSAWIEVGGGGGGTSDPMNDSKFTALITMDIGA